MKCEGLTKRQSEVAERVAKGFTNKQIARDLEISVKTVDQHIRVAAERLPGEGWPRHRLTLFFLHISKD